MKRVIAIASILIAQAGFCQKSQSANDYPWITYPTANVTSYGVYHFRRVFDLENVPEQLQIQVSADNRYQLFVNGERICYGPAKGDLKTYKYDEIDIAPYLKAGQNVIAALVFNAGKDKPLALLSAQTAFMLKTNDERYAFLITDENWKTYKNPAYDPITYKELNLREWLRGFYAVGPGDEVFGNKYPWDWERLEFDDSKWVTPEKLDFNGDEPWSLVPRNIAFMKDHIEKPKKIRRSDGADVSENFLNGKGSIYVPMNSKAFILFDYEVFTMGYPELKVDGGAGSSIQITYAEALYEKPYLKAHRDSVRGKTMYGPFDIFHPNGKAQRTFRPLWKRAFRYIQLEIETANQPLSILSLQSEYSGYPYPEMGTFKSNDPKLNEIFEISQRTLRMCSGETYYDTPFYEQLSYGGDNRPISAISTYNSTDDKLFREVMRLYPQSVNKETGLFKSAYPSRFDFDMGTWSMAWVQTLYDYYLIRKDKPFSKQFVPDIDGVLEFYWHHMDEKLGIMGMVTNQNFVDWSMHKGSLPTGQPRGSFHHSALLTLYFVHTLDCTIGLYREIGEHEKANKWQEIAKWVRASSYEQFWDADKQLMADFPDKSQFSQHTSILAILCDVIPKEEQNALLEQVLSYEFDEMASSYFTFFLFKAMEKLGREDLYQQNLQHWDYFIEKGHTTCGETGFMSHDRSDCHAWSAHPAYFHLRFICGIKPAEIGFENVKITPHLGDLKSVEASMPHPKGRIKVSYLVREEKLTGMITLPESMNGVFIYNDTKIKLSEGVNNVSVDL